MEVLIGKELIFQWSIFQHAIFDSQRVHLQKICPNTNSQDEAEVCDFLSNSLMLRQPVGQGMARGWMMAVQGLERRAR